MFSQVTDPFNFPKVSPWTGDWKPETDLNLLSLHFTFEAEKNSKFTTNTTYPSTKPSYKYMIDSLIDWSREEGGNESL